MDPLPPSYICKDLQISCCEIWKVRDINYTRLLKRSGKRIQIITGTAAATLPTSSSVCIIFLIRAFREKVEDYDMHLFRIKLQKDDFTGGNRALNFFFLLGILNSTFFAFFNYRGTKHRLVRSFT